MNGEELTFTFIYTAIHTYIHSYILTYNTYIYTYIHIGTVYIHDEKNFRPNHKIQKYPYIVTLFVRTL